jgi:hypothetical protein
MTLNKQDEFGAEGIGLCAEQSICFLKEIESRAVREMISV